MKKWKFVCELLWKNGGNMLDRKIDKYLIDYYQKSDNALLITGALQVGKTYSIREFCKGFKSFIEINFIENPDAVGLFKDAKGSTDILMRLSIITNVPMIKGLPEALVLNNDNLTVEGRITYVPVYIVMFLNKGDAEPIEYRIDLGGLSNGNV